MHRVERLQVVFYKTNVNNEPVRDWLKTLEKREKKLIGEDIKAVQIGWPLGMPLVKKIERDLWEIRTKLENKISRVLFTMWQNNIVLIHGFIKKTEKIAKEDLELARKRVRDIKGGI